MYILAKIHPRHTLLGRHEKHAIHASIIFGVVGDLCILTPYHFTARCHHTEI